MDDVVDFAKPLIKRKPKKIILHVGTNNLKMDQRKKIKNKVARLADSIKAEHLSIDVAVSSIIFRSDDQSLNSKIDDLLYVNSLTKHRDELKVFMAKKPPDGLAINESKLDLVDSDQLVNLEGYTIVRRDRNKHGGGVCYYLRNTITFSKQYQLNQYCNISWKYFIKCEWFNVTTGRNCKVSCPHYRPISYLEKSFTKCQTKGGVWH